MKFGPNATVTTMDFRSKWRISIRVSAILFALSVGLLLFRGLNLGIEFEGGGVWEVPVADEVSVADGRDAVSGIVDDARVQTVENNDGQKFVRVQSKQTDDAISAELVAALDEIGGTPEVSKVEASWGQRITSKAIEALAAFFVVVALYLAWRLEWHMALGGLIAVAHDLLITAGIYAAFGFQVSPATVIALLTILGYSLYDTVVVYDKVLENQEDPEVNFQGPTAIINQSMNEVLARSVNTTITTVMPVLSMLVVGVILLGGSALFDFALALFIGLLLGTYSSIFVAAPILAWFKERDVDPSDKLLFTDKPLNSADAKKAEVNAGVKKSASRVDETKTKTVTQTANRTQPKPRKQRRKKRS